ncbi:MAG: hypothetical protein J3R72DRAFT_243261 [Linnemannia gamsii]|nr:MAG: hypothetical protein J3R72DRAFT_243261 [Linnemannia gamsii]
MHQSLPRRHSPLQHHSMEPATTRLFGIAELVGHLIRFLDYKSISRLMQTNNHLKELCTPTHYYNVKVNHRISKHRLFSSTESTQALARNTHHIRQLSFGPHEVAYYTNCIFAYQDQRLQRKTDTTAGDLSQQHPPLHQQQRPLWLAPPDLRTPAVLPIPPITMLTSLEISINYIDDYHQSCRYTLPSFEDPKATLTYICWIMDSNPHLVNVNLGGMYVKDERDIHLLATSIFGLKKLRQLHLIIAPWMASAPLHRWATTFFFACPPLLQSLYLVVVYQAFAWCTPFACEYSETELGQLQSWELSEEVYGSTQLLRRQESLEHLTQLWLWNLWEEDVSEDELRSILQHCPNLGDIMMHSVAEIENTRDLAKEVAKLCPKLNSVGHRDFIGNGQTWETMLWMLEELPPQQVWRFQCKGEQPFEVPGLINTGSLFRRHSSSLRCIALASCMNFNGKTIQTILVECVALERLEVRWKASDGRHQLCINLEGAILFPWACTGLQDLQLTIAIPDEPLHRPMDSAAPYYNRPPPITLSAAEKQQLDIFDALYRQIGALTELRSLNLRALFYDPHEVRPLSETNKFNSFPGMLTLSNPSTGRPGYLHHFAGLSKLQTLAGSVSAMTEEAKGVVGSDEIAWMEQHWPALETAHFFT